jgi:hypothetical protein
MTNRKYPESFVGKNIGMALKMMDANGTVSLEGVLKVNEEDYVILLAKTKKGVPQEMHIERDNIIFSTLACESHVQVVGALTSLAGFNGKRQ